MARSGATAVAAKNVTMAFVIAMLTTACIESNSSGAECAPASSRTCVCEDGTAGTQVCNAVGLFGSCSCGGEPVDGGGGGESVDGAGSESWFDAGPAAGGSGGFDGGQFDAAMHGEPDAAGGDGGPPPRDAGAPSRPDVRRPPAPDAAREVDAVPSDDERLGPQNEWGPAARVVFLDVPFTPDDAEETGCAVIGGQRGSGLSGLIGLAGADGRISDLVRPDDNDDVALVLLARAEDWLARTSVSQLGWTAISLYVGARGARGEWLIDPISLTGGNPSRARARDSRVEVDREGWFEADLGRFAFSLPMEVIPLSLNLARVSLAGEMFADGPGFGFEGLLEGYLTRDAVIEWVTSVQNECASDEPPSLCDVIGGLVGAPGSPPDNALPLVSPLLGGFDARVERDVAMPCDPLDPDDCNAISVCLSTRMEGVRIDGVAGDGSPPPSPGGATVEDCEATCRRFDECDFPVEDCVIQCMPNVTRDQVECVLEVSCAQIPGCFQ